MKILTTVAETIDLVHRSTRGRDLTVVGLVGAPGAGKSTIAEELAAGLGRRASVLPMDGYHLPQAELVRLGRRDRMGAPDTFDVAAFIALLREIRAVAESAVPPHPVLARGFDRSIEEPVPDAVSVDVRPGAVVLVEGNYLLLEEDGWAEAAGLLDLRLFLDLAQEERMRRLVARHTAFGKSVEDALAWAGGPDEANARRIGATRDRADAVLRFDTAR